MDSQNYESLTDPHLNAYFNNKRIRRHLIKAGLINRRGHILSSPSYEVVLARRTKRREEKAKLSHMIVNYVVEDEQKRQAFLRNQFDFAIKRARVQKIRESRHPQKRSMLNGLVHVTKRSGSRNARTPSPTYRKRSSVRAKSAGHPPINAKNQLVRRPTTAKYTSNNDYCEVTMIYYGPQAIIDHKNNWFHPNGDEIMVMQQHCGGENLIVFKGFVKPNEIFNFESRRHPEYPFAVALYINGLIDSRISVCCEYKHKYNVRLGSKYGLFGIYNVQKSQPCRSCRFEKRIKEILPTSSNIINPSSYRKSVVPSVLSTNEFYSAALLRTPSPSSEKEEEPLEKGLNRVSTVAQVYNDEWLEKDIDRRSSLSSSTNEIVDRPLSSNDYPEKQRHSSTSSSSSSSSISEISHHSVKDESESHHSSISSTDQQQQPVDTYDQNLLEADTTSSNDDIKSNSSSKQKRHTEEEQSSATQSDKNPVRQYHSMENIIVVWLDATVDNTDDATIKSQVQLRQIARTIRTFSDPEKCIQWVKEVKNEKIFLIVSGRLSENILEKVDPYAQIAVIYIFCLQSSKYEYLIDKYTKLKGAYTDISTICEHLKIDFKQWDNDLNTFQTTSLIDMKQLNSEQLQFIQHQLFKEYLLEIEYDKDTIHDLVEYCENLYAENTEELELIKQFESEYEPNDALHWYTKDCFAYHMLNRAIRMKDITILFQMSFFIRDINQQLEEDYSTTKQKSTLTLFRGQG
ncbi:unnamed protein product [Rotaria sp. Silwood2]|nr:unnamed protein product [Rotaria sp. Silwood2]CAF4262513.1 unnamed protein product [Rotaria sp. Silwood2]